MGCDPKVLEMIRSQDSKEVDKGLAVYSQHIHHLCKYELPVLLKEEDMRLPSLSRRL